jgi:hypothetical protein
MLPGWTTKSAVGVEKRIGDSNTVHVSTLGWEVACTGQREDVSERVDEGTVNRDRRDD